MILPSLMRLFFLGMAVFFMTASAFSSILQPSAQHSSYGGPSSRTLAGQQTSPTKLYMSDREKSKSKKRGVSTITIDKTETKAEEDKKKEEMWRVVLHNDEVHTFNYVIRSLCKVVGTLDRKASFEICVQTHGIGKATVTKTWKKQAEQYCLGLQRQGLTVSISPDEDFDGGHSGGGL
jgi:ATP-dependent Clp protease adapter protein ClpS